MLLNVVPVNGKPYRRMGNFNERLTIKHDLMSVPTVLRHVRSYENFVTCDDRVKLPPAYPSERWAANLTRFTLFPYLLSSASRHGSALKSNLFCA